MAGHVIVREPGSYAGLDYAAGIDPETHRYRAAYYPSVEEQIAKATATNLERHSSIRHVQQDLWTFEYDCPHTHPDEVEEFEGVDDLLDAWMEEHHPDLAEWTHDNHDARWVARSEGMKAIPEYVAYHEALEEYEEHHPGSVCLLSPQGSTCMHPDCVEGDEDGYEPMLCARREHAREAYDEFWFFYGGEST